MSSSSTPESPRPDGHSQHTASSSAAAHGDTRTVLGLAAAALGIVFGDIGTSPLYAIKECFSGTHGVTPTAPNVLGVLSLFFWSLMAVVTVKYLGFIMKADNRGEGGIFALLALVPSTLAARTRSVVVLLALFGAALLYGDGVITPAISVLSAVEGLEVAIPSLGRTTIILVTCVILVVLFLFQRHGTAGIGRIFGPVMAVWFAAIAALGVAAIAKNPGVLLAINPVHGARFFLANGLHGFTVLGAVVLCITGGEALYADMGHFGRRPIRLSWLTIVLPALLLSYFGQGALLLAEPQSNVQPFFGLVPKPLVLPMVALATCATVIASQALISGAFSLTRQAVQLGYCPRVTIVHTSGEHAGQIYIPEVNKALMVACVALVLAMRESTKLAAAYGIAVTGTMAITSIVYFVVTRHSWRWPLRKALPLLLLFLAFDLPFLGANLLKFVDGGWLPVAAAAAIFTFMTTWFTGRRQLAAQFKERTLPLDVFLDDIGSNPPVRVAGTAVFLTASSSGTPPVLLHHLKHNKSLHEQVILLSILSTDSPTVSARDRVTVEELSCGFRRVVARYGFMQTPSVPEIIAAARKEGLKVDTLTLTFYLGRETLLASSRRGGMARWRKLLFFFMAKNSRAATDYFGIPPGRVVELGMQVEL